MRKVFESCRAKLWKIGFENDVYVFVVLEEGKRKREFGGVAYNIWQRKRVHVKVGGQRNGATDSALHKTWGLGFVAPPAKFSLVTKVYFLSRQNWVQSGSYTHGTSVHDQKSSSNP